MALAETTTDYVAYPKAMKILVERLRATPEELAVWIFMGPDTGGIAAYRNANELEPPPRFYFDCFTGQDYLSPLMACWFQLDDIDRFNPSDRYITGAALIERWGRYPGTQPEAFIRAKIAESRLLDIHPVYGGTQGSFPDELSYPPLSIGLFALREIEAIELADFDHESSDSPETETRGNGRLNHDPELQKRANQIADKVMRDTKRPVTRNKVAKLLALERKMDEGTVLRRIRKAW